MKVMNIQNAPVYGAKNYGANISKAENNNAVNNMPQINKEVKNEYNGNEVGNDKNNKLLERINKGKKAGLDKIQEEENERNKGRLIIKEKAEKLEEGLKLRNN